MGRNPQGSNKNSLSPGGIHHPGSLMDPGITPEPPSILETFGLHKTVLHHRDPGIQGGPSGCGVEHGAIQKPTGPERVPEELILEERLGTPGAAIPMALEVVPLRQDP
jgi:hypothetical protein